MSWFRRKKLNPEGSAAEQSHRILSEFPWVWLLLPNGEIKYGYSPLLYVTSAETSASSKLVQRLMKSPDDTLGVLRMAVQVSRRDLAQDVVFTLENTGQTERWASLINTESYRRVHHRPGNWQVNCIAILYGLDHQSITVHRQPKDTALLHFLLHDLNDPQEFERLVPDAIMDTYWI